MVAKTIRGLRLERQYSQEYMALRLGISQSTYSRLEQGRIPLTWPRLNQIAQVFDIPLHHLIHNTNSHSATHLAKQLRSQLNELLARYGHMERELGEA